MARSAKIALRYYFAATKLHYEAVSDRKGEEPDVLTEHTTCLPCVYNHNAKAWVTYDIFEEYLRYLKRQLGCKGHGDILFVHNCECHTKDTFLPSNTSQLQLLDTGEIRKPP